MVMNTTRILKKDPCGKREMHAQTKWIRTISERKDYDSLTGGADTDAL